MPRSRINEPHLEWRRGRYAIVWWEGGERRRLSTGTADERGARQALADFQTQAERRPLKLSVDEALTRYEQARAGKVMAAARLREAAVALRAGFADLRVDQVNQRRWDAYAAGRVTRPRGRQDPSKPARAHVPRPVSTGTLRREFNVLRAALRLAWKDDFLVKPPVLEAPADSAPRDRYLTKAEGRRLLEACVTPHVRVFCALALFTGARKASILGLTWAQVNFTTGMIDFQEPGRQLTKKRRAVVPMGTQLRTELELAYRMRSDRTPAVVQFNGRPVPSGLRWSFRRLCVAAGLDWVPTPHHLKHSVASWFAMEHVPIDQVADWLATDPATLRKTYRKFDPTYLRAVAGALDL